MPTKSDLSKPASTHANAGESGAMGIAGPYVDEQTRWLGPATMAARARDTTGNLKGPAMTEKTASKLREASGTTGQAQICTRTNAQWHCAGVYASRFQDKRRGTQAQATLVAEPAVAS